MTALEKKQEELIEALNKQIKTLITRNEILERELTRVKNILYTRGIQPIKPIVKKWWQFWK